MHSDGRDANHVHLRVLRSEFQRHLPGGSSETTSRVEQDTNTTVSANLDHLLLMRGFGCSSSQLRSRTTSVHRLLFSPDHYDVFPRLFRFPAPLSPTSSPLRSHVLYYLVVDPFVPCVSISFSVLFSSLSRPRSGSVYVPSLSLSLSPCPSLSMSTSPSVSLCPTVPLSLCPFVPLSLCPLVPVSLSLYLSLALNGELSCPALDHGLPLRPTSSFPTDMWRSVLIDVGGVDGKYAYILSSRNGVPLS